MPAFLRTRTRLAAFVASLVTLGVIAFVNARWSEPVLAVSNGSPYTVPLVVDTNPDPNIVETDIEAKPAGIDIDGAGPGGDVSVLTFNGTVPGPEFRLKVGDTVIVHFTNNNSHATGIHWHGIELANASDGTPLTQNMVEPTKTFIYKFKVTRPGIYWYHPHHHSSTNQVFKGMYGSIIVTDPAQDSLQGTLLPSAADTMTMVLSDLTVCKAPGSNDTVTYDPTLPHASGGPLPAQSPSAPIHLCEDDSDAPDADEKLEAIDEDGNLRGDYAAGDVPNIQRKTPDNTQTNEGQTVLTNGMNVGHRGGSPSAPGALAPLAFEYNVLAGQGLRLQLVNAATTRFFRLILTTQSGAQVKLIRVGGQGGVLNHARYEGDDPLAPPADFDFKYTQGEILIDPGDRADVVAIIPAGSSVGDVLTMWTQDFDRTGGPWANIPTVPVAHFSVTGAAGAPFVLAAGDPLRATLAPAAQVEALPAATINLLDPVADFEPDKIGMPDEEIVLTAAPGASLGINGEQGSHDFVGDYTAIPHEASARYAAAIGGTLELTVMNDTSAHHPFHLHGFSIQPLKLTPNGGGTPEYVFDYNEFRDNIDIPNGYTLTYRVRLDDRPLMDGITPGGGLGRWVFHCHIFFHAVFGMISEFDVVAADGNERPHINSDDTVVEGNASDELTMTGTYSDPDGDSPITLTASAGDIVDDGGGQWTWTQTGAVSGLVYVTATDPDGLKDQIAFQLNVNQPPTLVFPDPPPTGAYTDQLTFGISATDPDAGDTITLGASGLPTALGFVDNGDRTGTVDGILTANPGVYVATFTANDGHNDEVSDTLDITVDKETTVLTYTGPTMILNGGMVTMTATLLEDDGPPVVGKTINFTLGAQGCSDDTDALGVASCNIAVAGGLGPKPITADFAGDTFFKADSDSASAIVFAFPTRGAYVLGNNSATGAVTWWGSSWAKVNALSGGLAPSDFKGFAGTVTLPTTTPPASCAPPWSTLGGNSPPPTDVVPAYMGVLVSSAISKMGKVISGNTTSIVVVQVTAAPGPKSPGKVGTGTVVGVFCQ